MFDTSAVVVVVFNVNVAAWDVLESSTSTSSEEPSSANVGDYSDVAMHDSSRPGKPITIRFQYCWNAVQQFLSMLSIGWNKTKVAFLAVHSCNSSLLWTNFLDECHPPLQSVITKLAEFIDTENPSSIDSTLVGLGLSQALGIINARRDSHHQQMQILRNSKPKREHEGVPTHLLKDGSRVVFIDVGNSDYAQQTSTLLNLAFAAQKKNIVIDVCTVGLKSSPVCQQIAHISGGFHLSFGYCISDQLREDRVRGLSLFRRSDDEASIVGQMLENFLTFHFSTPPASRDTMHVARQRQSTSSAVCYCHKNIVEIAYVCSSCLTIFCSQFKEPICSVCRVRFKRDRTATVGNVKLALSGQSSDPSSGLSSELLSSSSPSPCSPIPTTESSSLSVMPVE